MFGFFKNCIEGIQGRHSEADLFVVSSPKMGSPSHRNNTVDAASDPPAKSPVLSFGSPRFCYRDEHEELWKTLSAEQSSMRPGGRGAVVSPEIPAAMRSKYAGSKRRTRVIARRSNPLDAFGEYDKENGATSTPNHKNTKASGFSSHGTMPVKHVATPGVSVTSPQLGLMNSNKNNHGFYSGLS